MNKNIPQEFSCGIQTVDKGTSASSAAYSAGTKPSPKCRFLASAPFSAVRKSTFSTSWNAHLTVRVFSTRTSARTPVFCRRQNTGKGGGEAAACRGPRSGSRRVRAVRKSSAELRRRQMMWERNRGMRKPPCAPFQQKRLCEKRKAVMVS